MSRTVLHLDNISKTFGTGEARVEALKGIDLEVRAGELVALVGPSGSGKSTMLSIAGALLSPTEGTIALDGQDISRLSDAQRTQLRLRKIGFIFQGSNLVTFLRGRDQLLFIARLLGIPEGEAREHADHLLDGLGMMHRVNAYPEQMSGGERQRIAIGRALMNNPELILADEPTASLDSHRGRQVVQLLAEEVHTREKAGILVTHDERLIDLCDRVVRIHDGKLDEDQGAEAVREPVLVGATTGNGTTDHADKGLVARFLQR